MKSACSGAFGVVVWVKMTSSVGTTGAASSRVNTTPRISTPNRISDSTSVADRRSGGPIFGPERGAGREDGSGRSAGLSNPGLDGGKQVGSNIESELLVECAHAGRAGDVDFGQVVADHVQADEQHAALLHFR